MTTYVKKLSTPLCLQSASGNLEKLLQVMVNITEGGLQARDISYATALLERFEEASFQSEEVAIHADN